MLKLDRPTEFQSEQLSTLIIIYLLVSFKSIVTNHEPSGSRFFFTRSIYHITCSLLEKYGYDKIITTLWNIPTIEYYDPFKFLRYGESRSRKLQVITLINLNNTWKRARLKQTCCANMCTFLRAESSFIWYNFSFATIYLSRYMFIKNWDFDVLPITFDENFMLRSLAESMKYD